MCVCVCVCVWEGRNPYDHDHIFFFVERAARSTTYIYIHTYIHHRNGPLTARNTTEAAIGANVPHRLTKICFSAMVVPVAMSMCLSVLSREIKITVQQYVRIEQLKKVLQRQSVAFL